MVVGNNLAITNHAVKRLQERMNVKKKNISAVVNRAIRSQEEVSEKFLNSGKNLEKKGFSTFIYKQHGGIIFVFQKKWLDTVLVTVFKYDK